MEFQWTAASAYLQLGAVLAFFVCVVSFADAFGEGVVPNFYPGVS